MSILKFPSGKTVLENKFYTNNFLELTLSEIREAKEFTGFLKLDRGEVQDMLFFLRGKPYAVGRMVGQKPYSRDIREFFEDLPKAAKEDTLLSLHEIDPVVLKSLLVYFQKEPTVKASTKLINFDGILNEIDEKSSDALVILKKEDGINFFFFLKGKPVIARYATDSDDETDKIPVAKQLLLYAYPKDRVPVEALVYLDISTSHATDAEDIGEADLIDMIYKTGNDQPLASRIVLSVIKGPATGKRFEVPLPCTIGRKECDIILHDKIVSGRHAILRELNGKLLIEDLDSTNGTYVNGVEIKAKELSEGEVITIGETRLRVEGISLSE